MDILTLNKKAWDKIGGKTASPYIKHKKYLEIFNLFCKKLPKNAAVLDLGCGPGLPITKELVSKGFRVTALDISDTMIKLAKKNVVGPKYIKMSMTDIAFKDQFDGIISSYTMLCLDVKDFIKTAKKIAKALKKNGFFFLILNEPPPNFKAEPEDNFTEIDGQKMFSRPYPENEIQKIFSECDLKIIKVARETIISKMYGKEYCLIVLMQK
ncbi:MAG: class I SAM-dependent methyltransferase [Patescibacteria group bacterium]